MLVICLKHIQINTCHQSNASSNSESLKTRFDMKLVIHHSSDWEEMKSDEMQLLCHGPTYLTRKILQQKEKFLGVNWLTAAHSLDGPYTIVRWNNGIVEIARSLYRGLDIFYTQIENTFVFSTNLPWLLRLAKKRNPDLNKTFCRDFIADQLTFSEATPFSALKSLCLGQAISSDLRSITELASHIPPATEADPVELLTQKMHAFGSLFP